MAGLASDKRPTIALVANARLSASGHDRTYVIAHDDHHRFDRIFRDNDLVGREIGRARTLVIVELDGFIADTDTRIDAARAAGLDGLRVIGALPLL